MTIPIRRKALPAPKASTSTPLLPAGVESFNFDDFMSQTCTEVGRALPELKVGREETPCYFCSARYEKAPLHYEAHESIRAFFRCTGKDCLFCRFGKKPTMTILMPVYSLHDGDVRVLRVPMPEAGRQEAHSLFTQLRNVLRSGATQAVFLSRDGGSNRVTVRTQAINPEAVGNLAPVKAFEQARASGEIVLAETFRTFEPTELAQVPWVQARLQAEQLLATAAVVEPEEPEDQEFSDDEDV